MVRIRIISNTSWWLKTRQRNSFSATHSSTKTFLPIYLGKKKLYSRLSYHQNNLRERYFRYYSLKALEYRSRVKNYSSISETFITKDTEYPSSLRWHSKQYWAASQSFCNGYNKNKTCSTFPLWMKLSQGILFSFRICNTRLNRRHISLSDCYRSSTQKKTRTGARNETMTFLQYSQYFNRYPSWRTSVITCRTCHHFL